MKTATNNLVLKSYIVSILLFLSFFMMSCATSPKGPTKKADAERLISKINKGSIHRTEGFARIPFALDTEILYLETDVVTFWKNLSQASFTMNESEVIGSEKVSDTDWKLFAATFDMKNFFEKYTSEGTSLVRVQTKEGMYLLLLEEKKGGYPTIRGFKGPLK